jgi:GntR family transcriptional repressor for pyruvate dehydrogenase complex
MAVTDQAILKIQEMIIAGELMPGDRLPPEKELSERLGLSRNSLREAVKALEVIRVLDVRRGDGTYVTSLEPKLLLDALSFVAELYDDDSILEILAVRSILEPAAASLAATRITAPAIAGLHAMIDSAEQSSEIEPLVEHDLAFHRSITEVAGNQYLSSLLDGLSSRTVRVRVWRGLTEENAVDRTLREHRAIVKALEHNDAVLVSALVTVHINGVESWLRDSVRHAEEAEPV